MMLETTFTVLSQLLFKNWYFALISSFTWGMISIILSPCHLAGIPLLISYIGGQERISAKRAFTLSVSFASGMLLTIAIIGIITGLLGKILGNLGVMNNVFVFIASGIFIISGLNFTGVIPFPDFFKSTKFVLKKKGLIPAFFMGLVFGTVLGPCTFAFMAPVLGVVFSTASNDIFFSILIILMYASGHCLVIVLSGTFTGIVQKFINRDEKSMGTERTRKAAGIIMILVAGYLLYNTFI